MVPILAKQAVQIKTTFENARLTGNYELAYALGILSAQAGLDVAKDYESMEILKERIVSGIGDFHTEDERMNKMMVLLKEYTPSDCFDTQMKELYEMGYADKKL